MKAYTLEQACLTHLSILINCANFGTTAQDNPYSNDNITYIDANIPDNDKRLYIPLTSQEINIFFELGYQYNKNLMIVHMLILIQNGISQSLGFLIL